SDRILHSPVRLGACFDENIPLIPVFAPARGGAIERRAITAAAARGDAPRVAGLQLGDQYFGVREVGLPLPAKAKRNRIAGCVATALEAPRRTLRTVALGVDDDWRKRAGGPCDSEAAAIAPGAGGIGIKFEALD